MLEKEVLIGVERVLELYEFHGTVIWYERLNSGKVRVFGHWVRLCKDGTSDYVAVIRNRDNGLSLLFLECKRGDGKGKLREAQEKFRDRFIGIKDVHYLGVTDPLQVRELIGKVGFDKAQYLLDRIEI